MLFDSTRTVLLCIVHSLERVGESGWDDHLESGMQCLYDLHQMARANATYKPAYDVRSTPVAPVADRASHAIPHVKLLVNALRRRDSALALASGKAAVEAMNRPISARGHAAGSN